MTLTTTTVGEDDSVDVDFVYHHWYSRSVPLPNTQTIEYQED